MSTSLVDVKRRLDADCLHCAVLYALQKWAEIHAERSPEGVPKLDMSLAILQLAEVLGDLVHDAPDERTKAQYERYARECLEGVFRHRRTGELIAVSVGLPDGVQ